MKQVRQLCFDQLKRMTDDQIIQTITNSSIFPSPARGCENCGQMEPQMNLETKMHLDMHMDLEPDLDLKTCRNLEASKGLESPKDIEANKNSEAHINLKTLNNLETHKDLKAFRNLEARKDSEVDVSASSSEGKGAGRNAIGRDAVGEVSSELEEAVQMVPDMLVQADPATHLLHTQPGHNCSKMELEALPSKNSPKNSPYHEDGERSSRGEVEKRGDGGEAFIGEKRREGEYCGDGEEEVMDFVVEVKPERMQLCVRSDHKAEKGKKKSVRSETDMVTNSSENEPMVNKFDYHNLCGTAGTDELLEVKLRRRAMQSKQRHSDRKKCEESRTEEPRQAQAGKNKELVASRRLDNQSAVQEWNGEVEQTHSEDVISMHPQCESKEEEEEEEERFSGGKVEGGRMGVTENLEEKLRRRALQSMLARRKANPST